MMKLTLSVLILACVFGGAILAGSAVAQSLDAAPVNASASADVVVAVAPVDGGEALGVAGDIVSDVRSGNWREVATGLLLLVMFGLGKFRDKLKWFKGDRGGAVLVGVLALAGALATALASDASLDWRLFSGAAMVMFGAVGGYTWVKRLIWPKD